MILSKNANRFNDFYVNKINEIRSKIPVCSPKVSSEDTKNFSGTTLNYFEPVTTNELRDIIKESKIKTCANDPVPTGILKNISDCLLPYFTQLINRSFLTGNVDGLKESMIIPLLKSKELILKY